MRGAACSCSGWNCPRQLPSARQGGTVQGARVGECPSPGRHVAAGGGLTPVPQGPEPAAGPRVFQSAVLPGGDRGWAGWGGDPRAVQQCNWGVLAAHGERSYVSVLAGALLQDEGPSCLLKAPDPSRPCSLHAACPRATPASRAESRPCCGSAVGPPHADPWGSVLPSPVPHWQARSPQPCTCCQQPSLGWGRVGPCCGPCRPCPWEPEPQSRATGHTGMFGAPQRACGWSSAFLCAGLCCGCVELEGSCGMGCAGPWAGGCSPEALGAWAPHPGAPRARGSPGPSLNLTDLGVGCGEVEAVTA